MYRNAAFKSKDYAKAADAAKLALELDAENMEASTLLKKAEQAMKAEKAKADDSGADSADVSSTPRPAAKPLKSTKGMFDDDDDDDDDDDMFGD